VYKILVDGTVEKRIEGLKSALYFLYIQMLHEFPATFLESSRFSVMFDICSNVTRSLTLLDFQSWAVNTA
jgi:hypothetical protein